jgi:hypothetical protein
LAEQAAGLAALQSWAKHSLEELSATMGLMSSLFKILRTFAASREIPSPTA